MIKYLNGHWRSERTPKESAGLLEKDVETLTAEEREAVQQIAAELAGQVPEGLLQTLGHLEWVRTPVDMQTFCMDPYYLGNTCDNLYPILMEDLKTLFSEGYREAIFTGAIGWGKTFAASIGICRLLYILSCMRDPHRSFGIAANSNISIVCLSVNEILATKVAYENIATKIEASPYFQEHFPFEKTKKELRFPRKVWVAARASNDGSVLGLNVIGGLLDETNFMPKATKGQDPRFNLQDRAEVLYNAMQRRMKSRFERKGKLPGILFVVSSKQTNDDFTAKRIKQSKQDPTVFVRDYCLSGDTVVPLLDGTAPTLAELAEKHGGTDATFEVYSFDARAGRIVPGKASRPRLTMKQERVLEVGLDNGEVVRATAWHPFMLKSGEYKRAGELQPGDSLMPLYRRVDSNGYEELGQPWWGGRWQKTHHMSARYRYGGWPRRGEDGKPVVVHHENFMKTDNRTSNLVVMEWDAHRQLHARCMNVLCRYVQSEEHRRWASEHMRQLHQREDFRAARNQRSAAQFKALWEDPEFREKASVAASERLSAFHKTKRGREEQSKRSLKAWEGKRKVESAEIIKDAACRGLSITVLAEVLGCTPGAISNRLKRLGLPRYSELKRAAGHFSPGGNHKVVFVRDAGREDVYDLTVEGLENFAVGAGVFVHNSLWDVKPDAYYTGEWFHIVVGNEQTPSRVVSRDEDIGDVQKALPEDCVVVEVPEDFRPDFEKDLEGAVRDLAGVATISISPYIQRRTKIIDAIRPDMRHPFSVEVYDPSQPGLFYWHKMVRPAADAEGGNRPIVSPYAPRHVHIDPSLRGDATGFAMGHVSGYQDVVRRDDEGQKYPERAPEITVDVVLQIVPPTGGEIILGDVRKLVYQLARHGYMITCVSIDSWNSADAIQKLNQKGFNAIQLSVDRTMGPYDLLKTALYEDRLFYYEYPPLLQELRELEHDRVKRKVDHPLQGTKDVSDAVAGVVWTLTEHSSSMPLSIMRSIPEHGDAWMQEHMQAALARNYGSEDVADMTEGSMLPPFLIGSGGGWGD